MTRLLQRSSSQYWLLSMIVLQRFGCFNEVSAAYSLTISPGSEECFYVHTLKERPVLISGSFECIDDDVESRDVSVTLSNPDNGEIFYEAPTGSKEGLFQLDDSKVEADTRYALCFGNRENADNADGAFDIGFSIHLSYGLRTLKDGEIGPDAEKALLLVRKSAKILQDWDNMLDHYEYVRNREALHQEMNNAILSRLSRWTYIEALLVVGMATGQVLYWKRFFETRRWMAWKEPLSFMSQLERLLRDGGPEFNIGPHVPRCINVNWRLSVKPCGQSPEHYYFKTRRRNKWRP